MKRLCYINMAGVRIELSRVVDTVHDLGARFVVHRHNQPLVVIISADEYRRFEQWEREQGTAEFTELTNQKLPIPRGAGRWSSELRGVVNVKRREACAVEEE